MDSKVIVEQVKDALGHYLDVYFCRRDFEATVSLLSPRIGGFGTGKDEAGYDPQSFIDMYERDISSLPDPIGYQISFLHIEPLSESVAIASFELKLDLRIARQKVKLNNLRSTLVFHKYGDAWLIDHKHISFPATEHGEDESYPNKELEERNVVLERLVREKTADLNRALEEINVLAITDKLTGLFNRSKLDERLAEELGRSERYGNSLSVIMIDIDNFKGINDDFGHLAGDKFLKEFCTVIRNNIRKIDIPGRWGGEEFLVISPETDRDSARVFSEHLLEKIGTYGFDTVGRRTASFGIGEFRKGDTAESLIGRADDALYRAKEKGRNRVESD